MGERIMVMLWRNALHVVQAYLCLKAQLDVNIVEELCVLTAEARQLRIIDARYVEAPLVDNKQRLRGKVLSSDDKHARHLFCRFLVFV
jgi:hypothetical protein